MEHSGDGALGSSSKERTGELEGSIVRDETGVSRNIRYVRGEEGKEMGSIKGEVGRGGVVGRELFKSEKSVGFSLP